MIGCYGKLPLCGDFVSFGELDTVFAAAREWLHAAFGAAQCRLPEGWDSAYRVAPIWRFATSAGVFSPEAVSGVLSPSVDRAGRLFPLLIMGEWQCDPSWYEDAESLLLDVFSAKLTDIASFESGLRSLNSRARVSAPVSAHWQTWFPAPIWPNRASIWWTSRLSSEGPSRPLIMDALPEGAELAAMLGDSVPVSQGRLVSPTVPGGVPSSSPWSVGSLSGERGLLLVLFGERTPERSALLGAAQALTPVSNTLAWVLALAESLDVDIRRLSGDLRLAGQSHDDYAGLAVVRASREGLAAAVVGTIVIYEQRGDEYGRVDSAVAHAPRALHLLRERGAELRLGTISSQVTSGGNQTIGYRDVAEHHGVITTVAGSSYIFGFAE